MCDFCTQHGEGKTWYLNAKNYSEELFRQKGREALTEQYEANFEAMTAKDMALLDYLRNRPLVSLIAL